MPSLGGGTEFSHPRIPHPPLDCFLVARSGVERVPAQLFLRYPLSRIAADFVALTRSTHSFALWVPIGTGSGKSNGRHLDDFRGRKVNQEQLRGSYLVGTR